MSIKVTSNESTFKIESVDRDYLGPSTTILEVTADGGVNGTLTNGSVVTADLATKAVTKAKALVFFSTEATGTGASQNIAHGLGVTPAGVLVAPTDLTAATVGQYSCVEGSHSTTNVVVTVTSGKKFKVFAWG